jgi:hypothetical protein
MSLCHQHSEQLQDITFDCYQWWAYKYLCTAPIHTIRSIVSPFHFIHVSMIATTVIHFMFWSARIKEITEHVITNIVYITWCLQWLWTPTQMDSLSNPQFFVLSSEDILSFLGDSVTIMLINKLIAT